MGYSSRYHVASLAAVFVALAIGILIGAALGSDVVSGTAENLEDDLGQDLDALREENASLSDDLEFERNFGEQIYPAVVGNRLAGEEIALIGLGNVDMQLFANEVEAALRGTRGQLVEVAAVREPVDADALIEALVPSHLQTGASETELLGIAGERAGRILAGQIGSLASVSGPLLSSFSGGEPEGIDAVVIARQRPEDLAGREEDDVEVLEEGIIDGLRDAGARVVGAERTDADPTSIGFFGDQGLATVDNIDQRPGKVALVLALDGADGDFGVKESAESLLPELIGPAPGITDAAEPE